MYYRISPDGQAVNNSSGQLRFKSIVSLPGNIKIKRVMIKRYIKKQVWKAYGVDIVEADAAYHWIVDAPIWQWRTRLWCVLHRTGVDLENLYKWVISK